MEIKEDKSPVGPVSPPSADHIECTGKIVFHHAACFHLPAAENHLCNRIRNLLRPDFAVIVLIFLIVFKFNQFF
jgi:hypothetical protein